MPINSSRRILQVFDIDNCNSARISSDHLQSHQVWRENCYFTQELKHKDYPAVSLRVTILNQLFLLLTPNNDNSAEWENHIFKFSPEMYQTSVSIKSYLAWRYLTDHGKIIYIFLLGKNELSFSAFHWKLIFQASEYFCYSTVKHTRLLYFSWKHRVLFQGFNNCSFPSCTFSIQTYLQWLQRLRIRITVEDNVVSHTEALSDSQVVEEGRLTKGIAHLYNGNICRKKWKMVNGQWHVFLTATYFYAIPFRLLQFPSKHLLW